MEEYVNIIKKTLPVGLRPCAPIGAAMVMTGGAYAERYFETTNLRQTCRNYCLQLLKSVSGDVPEQYFLTCRHQFIERLRLIHEQTVLDHAGIVFRECRSGFAFGHEL